MQYIALGGEGGTRAERGSPWAAWYATLRHEQENLLAAHAWCAHAPARRRAGVPARRSLWRYWKATSQPERGYRLAQAALELGERRRRYARPWQTLFGMAQLRAAVRLRTTTRCRAPSGASRSGAGSANDPSRWRRARQLPAQDCSAAGQRSARHRLLQRGVRPVLRLANDTLSSEHCGQRHRGDTSRCRRPRLRQRRSTESRSISRAWATTERRMCNAHCCNLARLLIAAGSSTAARECSSKRLGTAMRSTAGAKRIGPSMSRQRLRRATAG